MNTKVLLLVVLLMSGCALTPEQEEARFQSEVQAMRDAYGQGCRALGEWASDPWVRCVMERSREAARARAAFGQALGQALQNYGNTRYGPEATKAQQFPAYQAPVYQAPRQTDCQTFGTRTQCTQY